jgi:hypothetical protein
VPGDSAHIEILKHTDFLDIVITNVLRNMLSSRKQQLKLADKQYTEVLKNKI